MNGEYRLENAELRCHFATRDGQLWFEHFTAGKAGESFLAMPALFCSVGVGRAAGATEATADELRVHWYEPAVELQVRLAGSTLSWAVHVENPQPEAAIYFPFVAELQVGAAQKTLAGMQAFQDSFGRPIFRHVDFPLPLVKLAPEGRTLTLLPGVLPQPITQSGLEPLWSAPGIPLAESGDCLDMELILHEGGWPAAFDRFRTKIRSGFDLTQYERPDLDWYGEQLVHHFTFLYGREILNLESGQFELERFLDEGEALFGGYDGFLIWGVYPRIGVDERTQWDFYDDFPGGRAGLRAMAQRARARGVRFFIPYKPWDRSADLHGRSAGPDHEQLARLVADVEADGVFLDTMSAIGGEFRTAIDRLRPGVVLCSEGRAKGEALEVITSAWDQSFSWDIQQGNWAAGPEMLPGVDLWRFLFPEHRLFVISRHAVGDDRLRIIQRGFFSGMGWVVWQDIFGLVLTYAPDEAALLKKCRTILRQHRQALWSAQPTPLIPTLVAGVYANEFPGCSKRLWTFYNENQQIVNGRILQIKPRPGCHYVDVWNEREVEVDGEGCLHFELAPRQVGAVVELPRLLVRQPNGLVSVNESIPNATLHVRQPGIDRQASLSDLGQQSLDSLLGTSKQPIIVCLVAAGEVLDQIVVQMDEGGAR